MINYKQYLDEKIHQLKVVCRSQWDYLNYSNLCAWLEDNFNGDMQGKYYAIKILLHTVYYKKIDIEKVHTEISDGKEVSLAVIIEAIRITVTKKGDKMALLTLRDYSGFIEVAVFPETYKRYKDVIAIKTFFLIIKNEVNVTGNI